MHVRALDPRNRRDVRRYIRLPFDLYRGHPLWVPPFVNEVRSTLDPQCHPFFQHSHAAFFLAVDGDEVLGRLAVLDNARYNQHKGTRTAFFYHFDSVNDQTVASGLFEAAGAWAKGRGLDTLWGPKGFLALDGQGLLVEGFEHRPAVGIAYNYPYYGALLEGAGFEKALDFVSCFMDRQMSLPPRYLEVADKVMRRSGLRTVQCRTKRELRALVLRVAATYNAAFSEVQGFVPMTDVEAAAIGERVLAIADPTLIKVLMHGDDVAGFVIAYPDLSLAVRRCHGRVWPTGWVHLLREAKRTQWMNFNGMAILPAYRGVGGNAMLYAELYHSLIGRTQFQFAELVQVQETNARMVQELAALQVQPIKRHRIYRRALA